LAVREYAFGLIHIVKVKNSEAKGIGLGVGIF
jgi:hypothetical protein